MRTAIYFSPPPRSPLAEAAAAWLGRDAFTGEAVPQPTLDAIPTAELAVLTADARRYGFHATLKAPFRLADGETLESLDRALGEFAASRRTVEGPPLVLRQIDGFLALVPKRRDQELHTLVDDIVASFERFRAPLSDGERARRRPDLMGAAERQNLEDWGYPYVFDLFRFHMTLTARVPAADTPRVTQAIEAHFGALIGRPLALDAIALFTEPEDRAPFTVHATYALSDAA